MYDQARNYFKMRRKILDAFNEAYHFCFSGANSLAWMATEIDNMSKDVSKQLNEFACRAGFVDALLDFNEKMREIEEPYEKKSSVDQS